MDGLFFVFGIRGESVDAQVFKIGFDVKGFKDGDK